MKRKDGKSEPEKHPLFEIPPGPVNPFVMGCDWTEPPCLLPGTVGLGRSEKDRVYCGWHGQFRVHGRAVLAVRMFDEFERWIQGRVAQRYCSIWTHHSVADLWRAMLGLENLGMPGVCPRIDCRWREERG